MCKQEIRKLDDQLVRAREVLKTNMLIRVKNDPFAETFPEHFILEFDVLTSAFDGRTGAEIGLELSGSEKGADGPSILPAWKSPSFPLTRKPCSRAAITGAKSG